MLELSSTSLVETERGFKRGYQWVLYPWSTLNANSVYPKLTRTKIQKNSKVKRYFETLQLSSKGSKQNIASYNLPKRASVLPGLCSNGFKLTNLYTLWVIKCEVVGVGHSQRSLINQETRRRYPGEFPLPSQIGVWPSWWSRSPLFVGVPRRSHIGKEDHSRVKVACRCRSNTAIH